ncbi:MAG: UDP-N-acetylmuramate--L-alanine ligase, partial [Treponema sp.]|nr:UDP-N-acetylmuramate--L-alanine ligase [Treponema sp.]
ICRLLISDEKNPKDYFEKIKKGLLKFSGGKRRSEIVGKGITKNGDSIIVIDDYGHHPTAIKTTLDGYKQFYSNRKIIVDFMSHTYSRTQALLEEFAYSFVSADVVILHKIYASARENKDDFTITGKTLFEKAKKYSKNVYYFEEIMDASSFVEEEIKQKNQNGYLFVTMGAGDNWKIGRYVVDNLIEKK